MTDAELRDKLAKQYAENECYVVDGVTTHAESFAAGWDAARTNDPERDRLKAVCAKLALALEKAKWHVECSPATPGTWDDLQTVKQALAEYRNRFKHVNKE